MGVGFLVQVSWAHQSISNILTQWQYQHHLHDARYTLFSPPFFSEHKTDHIESAYSPSSLASPKAASRRCWRTRMWMHIHDTFLVWLSLAPRALLATATFSGKELAHTLGSSSFCLFQTCHFLPSRAQFLLGTISPFSHFPFHSRFYQLLLCFPSFSSFSTQSPSKTFNHLIAFLSAFFILLYPSWVQGGVGKSYTCSFRLSAVQIYRGLLVLCFVFLFLS